MIARRCLLLMVCVGWLFSFSSPVVVANPAFENGVLDLRAWDGQRLFLNGEWEVFWQRLVAAEDLCSEVPDLYGFLPSAWNDYTDWPGIGYATYRLHVKTTLEPGTLMAIRLNNVYSAYALYIDDMLIGGSGQVGTSRETEVGDFSTQVHAFAIPSHHFDIILHVSNHHYARGGVTFPIALGTIESITSFHSDAQGQAMLLFGILLATTVYFLAIYVMRPEVKSALYLSFLLGATILGTDLVGQLMTKRIFPGISLEMIIFLWYSSVTWMTFLFILYTGALFPSPVSRVMNKVFLVKSGVLQLFFLVAPALYYTQFGSVINYLQLLGVLTGVVIVTIGIRRRIEDGWMFAVGALLLFVTILHDVLHRTNEITSFSGNLHVFGVAAFLLAQMLMQARRVKRSHEQKTTAELAFLRAQIKPHFLYNALNTIISISRFNMDQARGLLQTFCQYLRRSLDPVDASQTTALQHEIEHARIYLELEQARFKERLDVQFRIPENLSISVPVLVLQPIVENAVIHGVLPKDDGGQISICIEQVEDSVCFAVQDSGVGTERSPQELLADSGEHRGVALQNIHQRLCKLYGRGLDIQSTLGEGTTVRWCIPWKGRRSHDQGRDHR